MNQIQVPILLFLLITTFAVAQSNFEDHVQLHDINLKNFVKINQIVNIRKIPSEINETGTVVNQIFVDENGDLAGVITTQSLHHILDSLVFESIKNFSFLPRLDAKDTPIKYSFLINSNFIDGTPRYPILNKTSKSFTDQAPYVMCCLELSPVTMQYELSDIQLSNMEWSWVTYISYLENKIKQISGNSSIIDLIGTSSGEAYITFTINNSGHLVGLNLLSRDENNVVRNDFKSIFPMRLLPGDFSNSTLTISGILKFYRKYN